MAAVAGMFTYEEALTLLQDSWGIKDVENRLKNDRKALIDEIIIVIQEKVTFQTISTLASLPGNVKRPTFGEIKQSCLSGVGGLCYSLNIFTLCLLDALGFSAKVFCATVVVASPVIFNDHVLVLVGDLLKPNDMYLIDCGFGHPTFEAVPLDFETESPVYQDSFIKCKYVRHTNGMILRLHLQENPTPRALNETKGNCPISETWKQFYYFIPEPNLLEETIHTDYSTTIPQLRLTQTPRAILFPSRKAVIIMGNRFMIEKEGGRLETIVLDSDEEMVKAYGIHFPQLGEETVRRAIARWHVIKSETDKS